MKKLIIGLSIVAFSQSLLAGSIRIYNNDSNTHVIKLKCNGSSKTLKINRSATSTYTFHSTASKCDVDGGTVRFPSRNIQDGQAWKIKNGLASKN